MQRLIKRYFHSYQCYFINFYLYSAVVVGGILFILFYSLYQSLQIISGAGQFRLCKNHLSHLSDEGFFSRHSINFCLSQITHSTVDSQEHKWHLKENSVTIVSSGHMFDICLNSIAGFLSHTAFFLSNGKKYNSLHVFCI